MSVIQFERFGKNCELDIEIRLREITAELEEIALRSRYLISDWDLEQKAALVEELESLKAARS